MVALEGTATALQKAGYRRKVRRVEVDEKTRPTILFGCLSGQMNDATPGRLNEQLCVVAAGAYPENDRPAATQQRRH
jgi:hypothetical protein